MCVANENPCMVSSCDFRQNGDNGGNCKRSYRRCCCCVVFPTYAVIYKHYYRQKTKLLILLYSSQNIYITKLLKALIFVFDNPEIP